MNFSIRLMPGLLVLLVMMAACSELPDAKQEHAIAPRTIYVEAPRPLQRSLAIVNNIEPVRDRNHAMQMLIDADRLSPAITDAKLTELSKQSRILCVSQDEAVRSLQAGEFVLVSRKLIRELVPMLEGIDP